MSEILVTGMVRGMCATNTYFLYRLEEGTAVVVDPAENGGQYADFLKKNNLTCEGILLTHGHFDHIMGIEGLRNAFPEKEIPVYASTAELPLLSDPDFNLSAAWAKSCTVKPDVTLQDGQEFTLGGIKFKMLLTPGHTPGGCCYYVEEKALVLTGDTLFCESVGRTDFPGGSMSQLVSAIREKLMPLPGKTVCLPGHGESTSVEHEKLYNPYL